MDPRAPITAASPILKREEMIYGPAWGTAALLDVWGILQARHIGAAVPEWHIESIVSAIASGDMDYLRDLTNAVRYYRDPTFTDAGRDGIQAKDRLRYLLLTFALVVWPQVRTAGENPSMFDIKQFLGCHGVWLLQGKKKKGVVIPRGEVSHRQDHVKEIWRDELHLQLAGKAGRPRAQAERLKVYKASVGVPHFALADYSRVARSMPEASQGRGRK